MTTDIEQDTIGGEIQRDAPITALYRWSAWCHVGPGADSCEDIDEEQGTNSCSNPSHVHLWCRLPNQFQHREIRERALAAKARRVRQLRDPDSDSAVILEEEMDSLARGGDAMREDIIEELVQKDWWRFHLTAVAEVKDFEDDKDVKPYEHIDADQERLEALNAMPEDERPAEEYKELSAHIEAYAEAVTAAREAEAQPHREALAGRDINSLIDMVRDQRIDIDSNEAFAHTYATLEWQLCTLNRPNGDRVWLTEDNLKAADEAVIVAVQVTYEDLERTKDQGGGPGNS